MKEIKREADFSKYILDNIGTEHNCHVCRVESPEVSAGIPDLSMCLNGVESMVELKYAGSVKLPVVRPTQRHWMRKRQAAGGNVAYLFFVDGEDRQWIYVVVDVTNKELRGPVSIKNLEQAAFTRIEYNEYAKGKLLNLLRQCFR